MCKLGVSVGVEVSKIRDSAGTEGAASEKWTSIPGATKEKPPQIESSTAGAVEGKECTPGEDAGVAPRAEARRPGMGIGAGEWMETLV